MKEVIVRPIYGNDGQRVCDVYYYNGKAIGIDDIGPFLKKPETLTINNEAVRLTLRGRPTTNGLHVTGPMKENIDMTYQNGAGEPLVMPTIDWSDGKDDPIVRVRKHLVAKHGETAALEKLRTMSGLQVLQLAEQLQRGQVPDDPDNNSMPAMKW